MFRALAKSSRTVCFRVEHYSRSSGSARPQSEIGRFARHFSKEGSTGHRAVSRRTSDVSGTGDEVPLGSKAFVDCDREAIIDLFHKVSSALIPHLFPIVAVRYSLLLYNDFSDMSGLRSPFKLAVCP